MFSDGDLAIASTLRQLKIPHFLCWFHILQNIQRNCRVGSFKDGLLRDLRRVKNAPSVAIFETCWNNLLKNYPSACEYLKKSLGGATRKQWARCFMSHHFTLDINTTSAIESLNAKLARTLDSKTPIKEVLININALQVSNNLEESLAWRQSRLILKQADVDRLIPLYTKPMLDYLSRSVSLYCFGLILAQMHTAALYYDCSDTCSV